MGQNKVEEFFRELREIDAKAYVELPTSLEEWKKEEDKILKMATVVLYSLWLVGGDLEELWRGWFYKEGDLIILIEPLGGDDFSVGIFNLKRCSYFVRPLSLTEEFEPFYGVEALEVLDFFFNEERNGDTAQNR